MTKQSPGFWPLIKLIPIKTNFRLMRFAKPVALIALLLSIGSVALTVFPLQGPCAGLNCGVDFKGGTVLELSTAPRVLDLGTIRSVMAAQGFGDVQVQGVGPAGEPIRAASINFETPEGVNPAEKVTQVKAALAEALGPTEFGRTEVVGPKVSGELLTKGIIALALGIVLMMAYIWFRFGRSFGVGAALALIHDVTLTFGLFAVTGMEFTLTSVAAILTVIGYSVNDTVVVLDRIRENLRKFKKMPMSDLLDLSINETFSRTVMTGITGLMALTGLAVFGGEALYGFSLAMIVGILAGTFSSFFIAAPALMWLGVVRSDEEPQVQVLGPASRT